MGGRRPTPTAIKRLAGNPGKRSLASAEPRPNLASAHAPHGLTRDALKLWRQIAPALIGLGVFTEVDVPAFVLMAEHYSIAAEAARRIGREGLCAEDENGALRKHPLLQVWRDNVAAFRMYAQEFGLTPASRTKVRSVNDARQLSLADELFGMMSAEADGGE